MSLKDWQAQWEVKKRATLQGTNSQVPGTTGSWKWKALLPSSLLGTFCMFRGKD